MSETTVYIDVLFLNNFIFDFLILFITGRILKEKLSLKKISLASLFGAIYAAAVFFPGLSLLSFWAIKIFISVVMLAIAFKIKGSARLFRLGAVFYLVSFGLFGGISALYYLTPAASFMDFIARNGVFYVDIAPGWLLFFTLCSAGILLIAGRVIYEKRRIARFLCGIRLLAGGKESLLQGYLDSGNHLKTPSGRPAAVVGREGAKKILPADALSAAVRFLGGESSALEDFKEALAYAGIRGGGVLRFESVGKESGLLPFFIADSVLLEEEKSWREQGEIAVAVSSARFGGPGKYDILLPVDQGFEPREKKREEKQNADAWGCAAEKIC